MKGFKWLLILFVGMISLTGFSSTTDLTEDSIVVSADVDVGDTILVDLKFETIKGLNLKMFSDDHVTVIPYRYQALKLATINNPKKNLLVPWRYKLIKTPKTKFDFKYKAPRDALNQ